MPQVRGYCPLCISRCGAISTVEAGRLVKVAPDPEHPTGKSFCAKGRAAPELVHSDRRILYPMMRSRPKGDADPGWRRVSWDEALAFAANGMRRAAAAHGPEAVAFAVTTPSGTAVADAFGWIHRLAHAFGSPNVIFATENCNWHKDHAPRLTFGAPIGTPDFENTGCMLFWGFNPTTSWPAYAQAARDAKKRGARLIVVDPRRAGFAKIADQRLAVRPGTDGALALAIAGVMIRNGWYDRDFIADWTNGPFLVRADDGRFLTMEASGASVVWDMERQEPVAVDRNSGGDREAGLRYVLSPTGFSASELRLHPEGIGMKLSTRYHAYRVDGFQTPTGRLEVYSERLLEAGLSPVPEYVPGPLPASEDYPLRLTSAKVPYFCHSQHHALPSLRRRVPEPFVELHPDLAREKGIKETDWVIIETPVGSTRARAKITEGIAADAVCAQYGWWEPCPDLGLPGYELAEANYNALIDDASYDKASGSNAMHGYPCSIRLECGVQANDLRRQS